MPPVGEQAVHASFTTTIASHPYIALATLVVLVLSLGGALVGMRSGVAPQGTNTWSAAGGIFSPGDRARNTDTSHTNVLSQGPTELSTIPLPSSSSDGGDGGATELAELLTLLSTPTPNVATGEDATISTAYSFIPSGLISVETPNKRTPEQQALYEYGNLVGSEIQSFENSYRDAPMILDAHARARTDAGKASDVHTLGVAYAELGVRIRALDPVPAEAASFNEAYGTTYRILGTAITRIATTTTDEEYIAAVEAYNLAAENLTKRFLAIVTLFGANNVTFSSSDAGSVFMFNGTLGF